MITVVEEYTDYTPPRGVRRTIDRLITSLPERYQSGLESVVLTNAAAVGRGKTGRVGGRKYQRRDCLGFYHSRRKAGKAWIEIIVDNIVAEMPPWGIKIPPIRDMMFAQTLYHEVGHHLNATVGSIGRGEESAAEKWCQRLSGGYFFKRYWYLRPLLWIYRTFFRRIVRRKMAAHEAQQARAKSKPRRKRARC